MKKTVVSVLTSISLAVFVLFAFSPLYKNAHSDILGKELEKRASESFKGVITVWQVDSFEGGVGSRTAWLNSALSKLEKKYSGVYFTVKSVSVELLPTLLEQARPDVISFGHGVFSSEQASELFDTVSCDSSLIPSLTESASGYAIPLFFGGYCLLTANSYTAYPSYKENIADFLCSDFGTVMHNKQKKQVIALSAGDYNTSVAAVALALPFSSLKKSAQLCTSEALWDGYNYSSLSASAIVSQRQLYRLSAATDKGKGRKSSVHMLGAYTDMVQYLAVFKGADTKKQKVISQMIEHLTSVQTQLSLHSIGIMPANIAALASIKYENTYMQQLCDGYKDKQILVPSLFASLDGVNQMAQEYLLGKSEAFKEFADSLHK